MLKTTFKILLSKKTYCKFTTIIAKIKGFIRVINSTTLRHNGLLEVKHTSLFAQCADIRILYQIQEDVMSPI